MAYLEVTVRIEQQIRWLQVAMKDVSRVQRFQSAECLSKRAQSIQRYHQEPYATEGEYRVSYTHLVYKVLAMIIAQILSPNDAMQIRLHQLLDQIDFLEVVQGRRTQYV